MPSRVQGGRKLAAFLRRAKSAKARSKQTDVGFFSTAKYPNGLNVAAVAAWNEFGTETIPERPFLRQAISGAERDLLPVLKAGIDPKEMVIDARTAGLLGEVMKARIQQSITTLREPPNAPITISGGWMRSKSGKPFRVKGKGSSNPLIDTGFMRQSVTYQVEDAD